LSQAPTRPTVASRTVAASRTRFSDRPRRSVTSGRSSFGIMDNR